jgi:hypothetical protein
LNMLRGIETSNISTCKYGPTITKSYLKCKPTNSQSQVKSNKNNEPHKFKIWPNLKRPYLKCKPTHSQSQVKSNSITMNLTSSKSGLTSKDQI